MQDMNVGDDAAALGRALQEEISQKQRERWSRSLSPLDWANESLAIARDPAVGYCIVRGDRCDYSESQQELTDGDRLAKERLRTLHLGPDYEKHLSETAKVRMKMAGVRLAATLNRIFAN